MAQPQPPLDDTVRGTSIIAAMKRSRLDFVISLPDLTTSEGVLRPLAKDPDLRHIRVCKEDEGIGICAGLSYCGKRSLMMMQNTGLFDSLNAVRALGGEYSLPICMLVGLLAKEPDLKPSESRLYSVRIVQPVLDAMGIKHHLLETESDVGVIEAAIDWSYLHSKPVAILVGRSPRAEA